MRRLTLILGTLMLVAAMPRTASAGSLCLADVDPWMVSTVSAEGAGASDAAPAALPQPSSPGAPEEVWKQSVDCPTGGCRSTSAPIGTAPLGALPAVPFLISGTAQVGVLSVETGTPLAIHRPGDLLRPPRA